MEHCQGPGRRWSRLLWNTKRVQRSPPPKLDFIPYERGAVNSLSTALGGDAPEAVAHYLCAPPSSRPRAFTHQRLRLRLLPPIRHGAAASKD